MDFLGKVKVDWGILTIFASDLKSETAEMSDLNSHEKKWKRDAGFFYSCITFSIDDKYSHPKEQRLELEQNFRRFFCLISNWSKILEDSNASFLYDELSCDKKAAQLCTVINFGRKRGDFCQNWVKKRKSCSWNEKFAKEWWRIAGKFVILASRMKLIVEP